MIKNKVKVSSIGLVGDNIKVTGSMVNNMGKGNT